MPEMSGFEATAALRALETGTGRHLPIIAMTAYAMKGDRERCLQAGMDGYVSKPVRVQGLLDALEQVVRGRPAAGTAGTAAAPGDGLDWAVALDYVAGDRTLLKD